MTQGRAKPLSQLNVSGWRLPVMDRYLATELIMPFVFGVGAFSAIGLAVGAVFELVRKVSEAAIPLPVALQIFLLQIPYFVGLSLPMAVLMATLIAYSRLAKDSEITALQGCGISIYRLVIPAVVLSLLIAGVTFAFNEGLVPKAKHQATTILEQVIQQYSAFNEKNIFYQEFHDLKRSNGKVEQELVRLFYAQGFDGERMQGLTILDFSQPGLNQVVTAESATWNPKQNTWNFFNGTIYFVATDGSYRNTLKFEQQQLQIPRDPLDLAKPRRDPLEMNLGEAQQYLQQLRQDGDEKKIRKVAVQIQQRYAFPSMCLVFGLIGSVLGTRPQRTSTATGFGISVLIVFGHYLFSFVTGALGQVGVLSPLMAAWSPTLLGLVIAGWLMLRVAR